MSRPLLGPCLGIVAGISFGSGFELDPIRFGVLICSWAPLHFLSSRRWPSHRKAVPVAGFFFLGWLLWMRSQIPLRDDDLRCQADALPRIVTLRGELLESPVLKLSGPVETPRPKSHVLVRVSELKARDRWEPASGDVIATLPGVFPREFFRTRTVEVRGVLKEPSGARAPGLFDARSFYALQGVWRMLETDGLREWQLDPAGGPPPSLPWSEQFLDWAHRRLAAGLPDDEAARLLAAMALGWKTPLTGEVDDAFMQSGTLHVFAISGLHIALVAGLLVKLFQLLRLSREQAGLGAIPCVWLYVAATGWQASAIRSGIMTTVIVCGWALVRPSDLLNSLAGAALAILLVDPGQLFQAGFQLSFVAVAGLAVLAPPIQEELLRRLIPQADPFLPASLQPRWYRWVGVPIRAFALALATGIAAGLSTLPLVWHFFHLMSPVGLIANLVVVPLSSLALSAEFGSLVCSPFSPWLGEVFNASAWIWMKLMVLAGRWSASIPGGHLWVVSPAWFWWIPWYALLVGASFGAFRVRAGRILWLSGLGIWVTAAAGRWSVGRSELQVTVFDQGEALGASASRGSSVMLVDAGSRTDALRILIPWAHAQGVGRLPWMVMSRSDRRHTSGLTDILRELDPSVLAVPEGWRRPTELSRWEPPEGLQARIVLPGERLNGWLVRAPDRNKPRASSADSNLSLEVERGGTRLLWLPAPGDRGVSLLASDSTPAVDILVATVPTQGELLSNALLDRLRPRLVVLASEEVPSPRRVSARDVQRLRRRGIVVWRTDRVGAVTIRFKNGEAVLRSMSGLDWFLPRTERGDASTSPLPEIR